MNKGFTLIEMIVVIAIVSILSTLILFSVTQYIAKGKDANIKGNLTILIPAGEVWYNVGSTYAGFCDSGVVTNAKNQIPKLPSSNCTAGSVGVPCCAVSALGDAWAACSQEFVDSELAFCVDSRGVKKDINNSACLNTIVSCN